MRAEELEEKVCEVFQDPTRNWTLEARAAIRVVVEHCIDVAESAEATGDWASYRLFQLLPPEGE